MERIFITGIGTGVGKTLIAAILAEALEADYWKPLQSGNLNELDSGFVKANITNSKTVIHPEKFLLTEPLSPHAAAEIDNIELTISDLALPNTTNTLIIEGAGGLMVPLNYNGDLMIDLVEYYQAKTVLVSRHYLGSINHTLATAEVLKARGIDVMGIIFNGNPNIPTERVILEYTGLEFLGRVFDEPEINKSVILKYKPVFEGLLL